MPHVEFFVQGKIIILSEGSKDYLSEYLRPVSNLKIMAKVLNG